MVVLCGDAYTGQRWCVPININDEIGHIDIQHEKHVHV